MSSHTMHLVVEPRDGWFFKTGQGWHVAGSGRSKSLPWPFPSTMSGALRTAAGRANENTGSQALLSAADWAIVAQSIHLDIMLAMRRKLGSTATERWSPSHRLWPAPADALAVSRSKRTSRIEPKIPVPVHETLLGSHHAADDLPLWWPVSEERGKATRMAPWWNDKAFIGWLTEPRAHDLTAGDELVSPVSRRSVHVTLDPTTGTADEGRLFATEIYESRDSEEGEWAIALRARIEGGLRPDLGSFVLGGNGYLGFPKHVEESLFAMPEEISEAFAKQPQGLRLIAVTPAIFGQGWLPDGFARKADGFIGSIPGVAGEVILRAAFVERPSHVSGWDLARSEPKRTERLVPPGSVYFMERVGGGTFSADDARNLWLRGFGKKLEDGFGRFVAGTWNPTRPMGDSR